MVYITLSSRSLPVNQPHSALVSDVLSTLIEYLCFTREGCETDEDDLLPLAQDLTGC